MKGQNINNWPWKSNLQYQDNTRKIANSLQLTSYPNVPLLSVVTVMVPPEHCWTGWVGRPAALDTLLQGGSFPAGGKVGYKQLPKD
jgi:hypothetical protein